MRKTDLTNACSMISFLVAQYFLTDGVPSKKESEDIFGDLCDWLVIGAWLVIGDLGDLYDW